MIFYISNGSNAIFCCLLDTTSLNSLFRKTCLNLFMTCWNTETRKHHILQNDIHISFASPVLSFWVITIINNFENKCNIILFGLVWLTSELLRDLRLPSVLLFLSKPESVYISDSEGFFTHLSRSHFLCCTYSEMMKVSPAS